jgi:hypothetical protein
MGDENYIDTYESYSENVMQYAGKADEYVARLDKCLKQKTGQSILDFIDIVSEDEFREHCIIASRKTCYAVIFSLITTQEIKRGSEYYFLLNGNSMDELVKIFKQLEFSLWELEFEGDGQAQQRVYDTVCRYGITAEAMYCTISFASKDKDNIINKVAKIYTEHGLEWNV